LSLNKENDSKIQDFSSPEVLKRDSSVKSGFFKNILSKFSASDSYSYNNENTYKKYTKLLWQECRTKILTTAVTVAAVISICTIVNFFDWHRALGIIRRACLLNGVGWDGHKGPVCILL